MLTRAMLRWIDRWIPSALIEHRGTALRARIVIGFSVVATLVSLWIQSIRLSREPQDMLPMVSWAVSTLLMAATPFALRSGVPLSLVGSLPSLAALVGSTGVALSEGGLNSPNMMVLAASPITVMFFAGRRVGMIASIVCVVTTFGMWLAHDTGHLSAESPLSPQMVLAMRALIVTALSVNIALVVMLFEFERQRHELELDGQAKQLALARDEALAATRAKSEFLANMSHEIRTPMNGVLGVAQLLAATDLDATQSRYVDLINASGKHLLTIVNDVLDLSKLEAGKLQLKPVPLHLGELAGQVQQLLSVTAHEKQLELVCDVEEAASCWVLADAPRLRQVLLNLVGNAVKFTEHGQVVIRLQSIARNRNELRVKIQVQDTGPGISSEGIAELFMPFCQLDSGTARGREGTGLGLAISRRLVELMSGQIGVDSELGRGSTFWVELRLARTEAPTAVTSTRPSRPSHVPPLRGRVLVADDNAINREVCSAALAALGIKADAVCDGEQAVIETARQAYDLVLMDCQMPGMDGYAATRAIRERERHTGAHLPIIAVTAHAMAEERQRCLDAGMDDHLCKPLEHAELERVLRRFLRLLPGPERTRAAAQLQRPAVALLDLEQLSRLETLEQGRPGLMLEVTQEFRLDAAGKVEAMRRACEREARPELARLAHDLRGSSLAVGASALADLAELVELSADRASLRLLRHLLESIDAEFPRSVRALERFQSIRPMADHE